MVLLNRPSSFFPNNWNKEKIIQKIEEAFNNSIEELANGRIGITKEGIKIQMWFQEGIVQDKKTIVIYNAYPLYK